MFSPRNTILRGRPNNFCDETSTNWKLLNDVPHTPPSLIMSFYHHKLGCVVCCGGSGGLNSSRLLLTSNRQDKASKQCASVLLENMSR